MDGNNQNNKINKEQILEFIRTPKGKAFLFFGIYFIFFIALSMIAHIGGKGPVLGSTDLKLILVNIMKIKLYLVTVILIFIKVQIFL